MSTYFLALTLFALAADEPIFEPGAKLTTLAKAPSAGEGPAWHPKLGVLTSGGDGSIHRYALDGTTSIFRKNAGTNGLLFDAKGRLDRR
jgi:gluconolactonase